MSEFYKPFPQIPIDHDYKEHNLQEINMASTVLFTPIEKVMMAHEDALPTDKEGKTYWDSVVQKEGVEAEPHLVTPEGRFQAFLNVANNGAKILALLAMSEQFEPYKQINLRMKDWTGRDVCMAENTKSHFKLSLAPTGAVARGDRDELEWARTPFGTAILPGLIYLAKIFEELDVNPQKALSATSAIKKDKDGNLLTTPPYERALISLLLSSKNTHQIIDIVPLINVISSGAKSHLVSLENAGLLTLVSQDPSSIDKTQYTVSDTGIEQNEWGIYTKINKTGEVFRYKKASALVKKAVIELKSEGINSVYRRDVREYISGILKDNVDFTSISSILRFYAQGGLLSVSLLNNEKQSDINLTTKGEQFIEALLNILRYVGNPTAVEEINEIRDRLNISLDGNHPRNMMQALSIYSQNLSQAIAKRFESTSPWKTNRGQEGLSKILTFIQENNGLYSLSEAARLCGVHKRTAEKVLKPYLEAGAIIAVMHLGENGKRVGGNKQYLSIPENPTEPII